MSVLDYFVSLSLCFCYHRSICILNVYPRHILIPSMDMPVKQFNPVSYPPSGRKVKFGVVCRVKMAGLWPQRGTTAGFNHYSVQSPDSWIVHVFARPHSFNYLQLVNIFMLQADHTEPYMCTWFILSLVSCFEYIYMLHGAHRLLHSSRTELYSLCLISSVFSDTVIICLTTFIHTQSIIWLWLTFTLEYS